MGTLRRWTGSVFRAGGTLKRWDGSTFRSGGTLRRWTGSGWQPPVGAASPFIGAAQVAHGAGDSGTTISVPVPSGVTPTDRCTLVLCNANAAATITAVTGCAAVVGPTDSGTQQATVYTGTGHTAGGTLTITGTGLNPSAVAVVWHRGRTHGTPASATRGASAATITAPAAPGAVTGDLVLVLVAEKSGANTDQLPPSVPGVTLRAWAAWPTGGATGMTSAYIGEYAGAGTARTATYLRSSANALAAQVRLTPA